MTLNQPSSAIDRFFAGLAENTFHTHLGVADPPVIDYVSKMLIRFVRYDALLKIRTLVGRPVAEIGEMLVEADQRIGNARREVHRHIGDFALFWAGVYPESLRPRRDEEVDRFVAYCTQGKKAYHIASTIETDEDEAAPRDVLERLSDQFEMCAYGLREVRREWERGDDDEAAGSFLIN